MLRGTFTGINFETHRGKILKAGASAGTVALATNSATETSCGVAVDFLPAVATTGTVGSAGVELGLVGTAGLTAGFHKLTFDASSRLASAVQGESLVNCVGWVFARRAYAAGEWIEFNVDLGMSPIEAAE